MGQEIIKVEQLSFCYPGSGKKVLNDIDLTIEKGDFIAVVGSNGSGKSTLCKTFNGLIPHYYIGDFLGKVTVLEKDTLTCSVAELSKYVGYVYQDFENQLVRPRVYDELIFSRMNFGFADYHDKAEEILELLELTAIRDRFIWQLSGGQKHMVALASVLTMDPEIIIIDEPAAQLDPMSAVHIYHVLKMLNEQFNKTIIVIEHHTEFIAEYCNNVILMDQGQLVWKQSVDKALNEVDALLERNIFPPQVTMAAHQFRRDQKPYPVSLKQGIQYFSKSRSFITVPNNVSSIRTQSQQSNPLIEIKDIYHGYETIDKKEKRVLNGVDLRFYEGDRVALVGVNGAGKSTLQKMITGIQKPKEGNVIVLGRNTREVSPEELAEYVTYIYQEPEEMFIADNIRADIEYFLKARDIPDREIVVKKVIEQFRLEDLQERDGRLLSGGQQRRASLAIGIAMRPEIMLLDEPTASLDVSSRKEIVSMMDQLKDQVKTIIVATHDMQLAADWSNRIIVMKDGQVLVDVNGRQLYADPDLMKEAGLKAPQITELSHAIGLEPLALSVEEFIERISTRREDA